MVYIGLEPTALIAYFIEDLPCAMKSSEALNDPNLQVLSLANTTLVLVEVLKTMEDMI